MPSQSDPLNRWLSLKWDHLERAYNPELRDLFVKLLGYPKDNVWTDDTQGTGMADLRLFDPHHDAWVVGEMKKDDSLLSDPLRRETLWKEKRKYVDGLTRYVIFITPHYLWITQPDGGPVDGFQKPLDLRTVGSEALRQLLAFIGYEEAEHARRWDAFCRRPDNPYCYLSLFDPDTVTRLQTDLRMSFAELCDAGAVALEGLRKQYGKWELSIAELDKTKDIADPASVRRARVLLKLEFQFVRRLFDEAYPEFEEQYGRDVDPKARDKRIEEAFIADSVAALIARLLFLRLVEDLELMGGRMISNGGPTKWAAFVRTLTGDARALYRLAAEDVARQYQEPFKESVFEWIAWANGAMDEALQRLILRLNAYNFKGLSEEILGDIYQQFLPAAKRKRLGAYYTPASIVDWILEQTTDAHGHGAVLDPACGSGSFLVRYMHRRILDARQRHLAEDQIRHDLQNTIWGFDLNPFAAFITQFQLMWGLLQYLPASDSPQIHVYNLNSLVKDRNMAQLIGEGHVPDGSRARDERKWKYIVGNPPYIRAERVKYGDAMKAEWADIWGANADTGLIFLYRAFTEWLEEGGWFGMVVSGGYANSAAAARIWRLFHPGGKVALRKIVWLEFAGRIWDPNVIPMLLIVERVPANPVDEIEILAPPIWPASDQPARVLTSDFFDPKINPRAGANGNGNGGGDYLLPLLQPGDAGVLRRLYPDRQRFITLGEVVDWTYGVQRGGVDVSPEPSGTRPIQVVAGRSIAAGWPGEPAGWVDLDAVEKRPFGKLSLWKNSGRLQDDTVFVSEISLAPFAAIGGHIAALNSVVVGRTVTGCRTAGVAAYLNSSLARFYWAIRLRSGVLEGSSRAHIYPRCLDELPWPKEISKVQETALSARYVSLAEAAALAKDNPNDWLLAEADRRVELGRLRLTEPVFGLRFEETESPLAAAELALAGDRITAGLFTFCTFANEDIAEYVYRVVTLTADDDDTVTNRQVQKIVAPQDYRAMMREYRERAAAFSSVRGRFTEAMAALDDEVFGVFGISKEDRAYITQRLSSFPLNRFKPRYPYETVKPRPIKAYMEDRFA